MPDVTSKPTARIDVNKIRKMPKHDQWNALLTAIQNFLDYYVVHEKADQLTSTVEALSSEPAKKRGEKADKSKPQAKKEQKQKQ